MHGRAELISVHPLPPFALRWRRDGIPREVHRQTVAVESPTTRGKEVGWGQPLTGDSCTTSGRQGIKRLVRPSYLCARDKRKGGRREAATTDGLDRYISYRRNQGQNTDEQGRRQIMSTHDRFANKRKGLKSCVCVWGG